MNSSAYISFENYIGWDLNPGILTANSIDPATYIKK